MIQGINSTTNPIHNRIMGRLMPLVALVLSGFIFAAVFGIVQAEVTRQRGLHEDILARAESDLETLIARYARDVRDIASDSRLRFQATNIDTASDGTINDAVVRFLDLLRLNNDDYFQLRYIRRNGSVELEVFTQADGVPQIASENTLRERYEPGEMADNPGFQALFNNEAGLVTTSPFFLRTDPNGERLLPQQLAFSLYAPVFSVSRPGEIVGAVQLNVDASELVRTLDGLASGLSEQPVGRQLLFVDGANQVVVDTLNVANVNQPLLRELAGTPLAELLAEKGDTFNFERQGVNVISSRTPRISGVDLPDWHLTFVDNLFTLFGGTIALIVGISFFATLSGFLLEAGFRRVLVPVIAPLLEAERMVRAVAEGQSISGPRDGDSLGSVVARLSERIEELEKAVAQEIQRRGRDLQIAGRIGRETATLSDQETLLRRAINMICNELGYYHAQVFLVDDLGNHAFLVHSRGEAGAKLLEQGHKIRVGSATVIGTVVADNRAVIVNNTQKQDGPHGFNPLLPETQAEMGLPLRIGDEVIGALDIQSKRANAFQQDDIPTLQLLADQLAIAIYNTRLRTQSERTIRQINRMNRQLTREAWEEAERTAGLQTGYSYDLLNVHPIDQAPKLADNGGGISAPISIRGQTIGSLIAQLDRSGDFTDNDRLVLNAVAERVALAIENARLVAETQNSLSETSTLYQLSRQINEADTLENILQAILTSVVPDAASGQIWLFDEPISGERPEIAELVADVPIQPRRTDSVALINEQLVIAKHPFFRLLGPTDILTVGNLATDVSLDSRLLRLFNQLEASALVCLPLNMRGVWKGFITFVFSQARNFSQREERIYNALIGQAGVAIDNRLLLRQTEDALSRNEKLYASSRIINTSQTLQDLVYAAVVTTNVPTLNFWLGLLEGEPDDQGWPDTLRLVAQSEGGIVHEVDETRSLAVAPASPLRRREPEVIHLEADAPPPDGLLARWLHEAGQRFGAIFALFSDNQPIALFFIVSQHPEELGTEDYDVYRALTGQMSTQIQNTNLLKRAEDALTETRRLYVASNAIATAQDTEGIYDAIAGHLGLPFIQRNSDWLFILTVLRAQPTPIREAPELLVDFRWTSRGNEQTSERDGTVLSHEDLPFGPLTAETPDLLVYEDLANAQHLPLAVRAFLRQEGANSAVVASLSTRRRWLGVLIAHSDQADIFTERYQQFIRTISGQVAVGLENQYLFQATEAERQNLDAILATLPTGVLVLDANSYRPLQANERVTELLGQSIDYDQPFTAERYNLYRTGTRLHYPNDELPVYAAQRLQEQKAQEDVAVILNDEQTDMLMSAAPIYDNQKRQLGIVVALQDISNLRRLENTLQENLDETVSLYETQKALSEAETLDDLVEEIINRMAKYQTSDAYVILADEENNTVYAAGYLARPIMDAEGLRPLLNQHTQYIEDAAAMSQLDERARAALAQIEARALLVIPLRPLTRVMPLGWLMVTGEDPAAFDPDQERLLSTLGDLATTAIDNRYLFQSTQAALRETASLYSATTTISRARDLSELGEALEAALTDLQPDMVAGFVLTEDGSRVELFSNGFEASELKGMNFTRLIQLPLPQQEGIYIADITRSTLGEIEREVLKGAEIQAFAAVNLRVKDQSGGRLFLGYHQAHQFTSSEERFLNTLADSASVQIDNQLLLEQIQSTLQETSVLYQASRALTETTTPEEIVDVIVNYLIEPHINQVFVAMLNTDSWQARSATVTVQASWQAEGDVDLLGVTLSPEQFPAWKQLSHEGVLTIDDIYDEKLGLDPLEQTSIESLDTRSLVIIGLRAGGRDIGAIWLGSREPHVYRDRDLRIFQAIAEQTSLSLEAARLLRQTERRARQLQTSSVVSQSVGQILDLNVLLPYVVDLIRDQFGYDHVQVFLMDAEDDWAVLQASTGEPGEQLLAIKHRLQKGSSSVIGQVTARGEPTIALDTADANVVHQPNPYLPLTRSEMALPLIIKGQVVGALDVQSNQPNAFNDEDVQALETLAAQISVAIDNARLYEESERRASDMGFLFEITTAAAAAETLENSLQQVATNLREALDTLAVVFYLPQIYQDYSHNERITLRAEAVAGTEQPLAELTEIDLDDSENLVGIVASTLQPQIVGNISREVRYYPVVTEANSAVLVPINRGLTLIGLIVMESSRLNAFNQNTLQLLLTLAGSLAAIIQNTQLVDELKESNEQLREVDRLKSQFLASMSHELRTPLNSIIGFSRVMLKGIDGDLTEMQEQDLTTIYNSGNHLLNLINDILDQAKIEAGQLDLKLAYFEVKPMIESVRSIGIGLVKEKTIDLKVEVAPNLPQAYGDEFRTRQILINIVSNAAKFTPEGEIRLNAYAVEDENGRTLIQVDVSDTGIGIDEKDFPTLFEQFRQVDSSLTRTAGGTGLGLPISKSLAEMQGGTLTVESELNVGSTFTVTIPTEPVADPDAVEDVGDMQIVISDNDDEASQKPDTQPHRPQSDTRPKRAAPNGGGQADARATQAIPLPQTRREVLLIEDNKEMVDQFRRMLQRAGFEVQTADSPVYAEAMAGNLHPTVIIMDVNFGEGAGWDILKRLKEQDHTFDIPIIVTSLSNESERAYQLGAHRFIQRPFLPDDVLDAVKHAEIESRRERILIIDDQQESIRLLTELLREHGNYRVFAAENGPDGISMVARRRPDLIILDLRMPHMDGFAVLEELKNHQETRDIPVMVVTGERSLSEDEQARLGDFQVLYKTDIGQEAYDRFIETVRQHLSNNGG